MGINIVGRDITTCSSWNKKNIAHFGFEGTVTKGPIEEITENYDVAIIDMPYDLFTHATPEDQLSILSSARRIAKR